MPLPEMNLACSGLCPQRNKGNSGWRWQSQLQPPTICRSEQNLSAVSTIRCSPFNSEIVSIHSMTCLPKHRTLGSIISPHALKSNLFESNFETVRSR